MGADAEMADGEPRPLERKQAAYRSLDEKYLIHGERYLRQQYSQIYFTRLHYKRNLLRSLVRNWKPHIPVTTILGLEAGKECILIGTIYKDMKLKPKILEEYAKERSAVPLVRPNNFSHPDDYLVLEDDTGRLKLSGTLISPSAFVTGVVMALYGRETGSGDFLVQDIFEAGLPPQVERPNDIREDKYVVFVSGLSIGSGNYNPLKFQLFVDHVTGHLGDENEQSIASQIVRVIIAGNSVEISQSILNGQNIAPKDQAVLVEPIKELEILLTQLAAAVPVDIMPGSDDPTNFSLPQQPLNRCLFRKASFYNTLLSCTNPHEFELDNIRFLGTSGQNIEDLDKYSDAQNKLEFMKRTLKWRHLAPSAPNTLGCFPFTDKDPFLLEDCPHVYFVGNQDKYETCILEGPEEQLVRLISIPRFCETGTAVMLNLRTLECNVLSLSTNLDG